LGLSWKLLGRSWKLCGLLLLYPAGILGSGVALGLCFVGLARQHVFSKNGSVRLGRFALGILGSVFVALRLLSRDGVLRRLLVALGSILVALGSLQSGLGKRRGPDGQRTTCPVRSPSRFLPLPHLNALPTRKEDWRPENGIWGPRENRDHGEEGRVH